MCAISYTIHTGLHKSANGEKIDKTRCFLFSPKFHLRSAKRDKNLKKFLKIIFLTRKL